MSTARSCAVAAVFALGFPLAARAEPLAGRVFDSMRAMVFGSATVRVPQLALQAKTDAYGFFRLPQVPAGPHTVSIELADGRSFSARVLVRSDRPVTFAEFDYARIVPPDADDDY